MNSSAAASAASLRKLTQLGDGILRNYHHAWMPPQKPAIMAPAAAAAAAADVDVAAAELIPEEVQRILVMDHLPNELLSIILKLLSPNALFHLREVCYRWRENIEAMYIPAQCLLFYVKENHDEKDLARRHFATDLQPFVKYRMTTTKMRLDDGSSCYTTELSYSFTKTIQLMFPNLEHLLVDTVIDSTTATSLVKFLPKWKKLQTLSIFKVDELSENCKTQLLNALNLCPTINRLGIGELSKCWYARLRYLSLMEHFAYEASPMKSSINDIMRYITKKTTNFWVRGYPLSSFEVERWSKVNPKFVAGLEKLFLGNVEARENERAFVNMVAFKSLLVLRIEFEANLIDYSGEKWFAALDPNFFATLRTMPNLHRLELANFDLNLQSFSAVRLLPIKPVYELSLISFTDDHATFSGEQFCATFASIFPNLENLYITTISDTFVDKIGAHCYQVFPKLTQFKSKIIDPPKKENSHLDYFCVE